ncbi:hypothetical protein D3C80_1988590 [compost metagenome]
MQAHILEGGQHIRITANRAHEPGSIERNDLHNQIFGFISTVKVIGVNQQNVPLTEIIPLPVNYVISGP